jgi:hypothetical protein
MTAELLDWVCAYLERDEDIVVPVKKMWNEWRAAHPAPGFEDFAAQVLADPRVEEMGGVDHTEDMDDLGPDELDEYVRDMEARGYYSGPRVKLRSRALTLEHIANMLKRHNDRMEAALRAARDAMPEDVDEQEEGMLIEAMELAKQLRQHLREAGLEPPDDDDQPRPDPAA